MQKEKPVHELLNTLCPKCTKTRLRAHVISKICPGLYLGPPLKNGRQARDGKREGKMNGRGGKGRELASDGSLLERRM
jgi:hypothetical protein